MLAMLTALPYPPNLAEVLGYSGPERYVAWWWDPAGQEACYADRTRTAMGAARNAAWLTFIQHPVVRPHLTGWQLGTTGDAPRHALVIDREKEAVYAGEKEAVLAWLTETPTPSADPTPLTVTREDLDRLMEEAHHAMQQATPGLVMEALRKDQQVLETLKDWLDQQEADAQCTP